MASLNRVQLIGNLGQDPELRYTQNQTAVCTLSVATTENRLNASGEREPQTTWHRVVVWSKQAENCNKYLGKGRQVYVDGRLQTRSWEDQNGNKRYTTEVVAQSVLFLGGNAGGASRDTQQQQYQPQNQGGNDFGGAPAGGAPASMPAMGSDSLDDIPF